MPPTGRVSGVEAVAVIVGALVVAAVVGVVSRSAPTLYEAEVILIAQPPRLGETPGPAVASAMFVPLVTSQAVAERVVATLPPEAGVESAASFARDAVRANALGGVPLVSVRVRLPSAAVAAEAANRLAAVAVEDVRQLTRDEAVDAQASLHDLHDKARSAHQAAVEALEQFRRESSIDLLREDVKALLTERAESLPLSLEIATARARLERFEEELASHARIETLTRAIDRDPALTAAAGDLPAASVLGLTLTEQVVNQVHDEVATETALARAEVAGLLERSGTRDAAGVDKAAHPKLLALYAAEREIARLELDASIARRTFEAAATQFDNARLQISTRSAQLQVLTPARPPDLPLSKRATMNALLAFVLAVAFLAGGLYAWRRLAVPATAT